MLHCLLLADLATENTLFLHLLVINLYIFDIWWNLLQLDFGLHLWFFGGLGLQVQEVLLVGLWELLSFKRHWIHNGIHLLFVFRVALIFCHLQLGQLLLSLLSLDPHFLLLLLALFFLFLLFDFDKVFELFFFGLLELLLLGSFNRQVEYIGQLWLRDLLVVLLWVLGNSCLRGEVSESIGKAVLLGWLLQNLLSNFILDVGLEVELSNDLLDRFFLLHGCLGLTHVDVAEVVVLRSAIIFVVDKERLGTDSI